MNKEELKKEKEYLKKTLSILKKYIKSIDEKVGKTDQEIVEVKRYIWKNMSDMDISEMNFLSDQAMLKRDTGRISYNKNLLYKKMVNSPYFGRVDFLDYSFYDEEEVYIGLTNLMDEYLKIYVYDWRSPIAGLFYDHELGKVSFETPSGKVEGEISLKRQYKIENSTLKYAFDSSININDEILQEVLSEGSTDKMKNIVSTIQKEQNKVIRNIKNKYLIVEGPAGSGKTSVALHRVAYLLYKFRDDLSSEETLIFSPNDVFSEYISHVLPELGERNILYTSFSDYMKSNINEYKKIEEYMDFIERIYSSNSKELNDIIKIKMSDKYSKVIDNYIKELTNEIVFDDIMVFNMKALDSSNAHDRYFNTYKNMPPHKRLDKLIDYATMKFVHSSSKNYDSTKVRSIIEEQIKYPKDFKEIAENMYSSDSFKEKLKRNFDDIDVERFCEVSKENLSHKKISYEDSIILLYLKGEISGYEINNDIKQVVIDEAQDYTMLQYKILENVFKNSKFTILGDSNQVVNPLFEYDNLSKIGNVFGEEETINLRLNKSYRNTYEITNFSNKILNLDNVTPIERNGPKPLLLEEIPSEESLDLVSDYLKDYLENSEETIAIITKKKFDSNKIINYLNNIGIECCSFEGTTKLNSKVLVLPVYYAKGLEFDSVIVYDSLENPFTKADKKMFYVACTRALHRLSIISENKIKKKLLEGGIDYEEGLCKTRSKNY